MTPTDSNPTKSGTELLAEALAHHRAGALPDAERAYKAVLGIDGNNIHALTLLGTLQVQRGDFAQAIQLLNVSLGIDDRQPSALNSLANAFSALRRYDEALACYDKAIALNPAYPIAHNNRSTALRALNRLGEALVSCEKAIALDRTYADAHSNRGDALRQLKRYDEAIASYDTALALRPQFARDHFLKGLTRQEAGRLQDAVASYGEAIRLKPDYAEAYNNRANALAQLEQYEQAIENYERAVALAPNAAEAYCNYGTALGAVGRYAEALTKYGRAIELKADYAAAFGNRALTLLHLQRYDEALPDFEKAIAIDPDNAGFHKNCGDTLRRLKRHAAAVASYDAALRLRPDDASAHYGRSLALYELGRLEDALRDVDKALVLEPEFPYALGVRLLIKARLCDWNGLEDTADAVISAVGRGLCPSIPFALLAIECPPHIRQKCAVQYVNDKWPAQSVPPARRAAPVPHERIRVAYLSADFRAHATASLMAGVFERHDRTQFELHAISFGIDDSSKVRTRVKNAFEHFVDVRRMDDRDVAALMRERAIDIAVDLMGFTDDCRPGILALRPAPIQVNYLGFPGTMGTGFIDYIIADKTVIPEESARYYSENVVYLPDTYQCNDMARPIADVVPTRGDLGLPQRGFVFCSFNRAFKITPAVFDVWMRLLLKTEGSVLWLLKSDEGIPANLRREAESRGVAGERLIFASTVALPDHLARQTLADLFLDTLPCGAHTTASEALWAGLPVLTSLGDSFAGRVAASLLHAMGLPELITHSLQEYEARALELARNPSALASVRTKLKNNRDRYPLFDTARFTRHLEAAYAQMWERHLSGKPPAPFSVDAA